MRRLVEVLDDETLLIPDRLGNTGSTRSGTCRAARCRADLFSCPPNSDVNRRARYTTDPALKPLSINGKAPRSGILVSADEIYFHCGKALIRSDLWNPEKQLRRSEFPSLGRILADQIGGISVEESERLTAESYRTRLY